MGLEMDDEMDVAPPPVVGTSAPTIAPETDESQKKADQERVRLARIIKELRLRVQTLENTQSEDAAKVRYAAQQKEEILNAQLEKVMGQFKAIKSQNGALREQNESLKGQLLSLNQSLEEQSRRSEHQGSEMEVLTEQYKLALEQRLEEERAKMSEQLHALEMDVLTRDDLIGQLREEIAEQKRNKAKDANSGAQKTLEKLEELGLSFIAFHPGAGISPSRRTRWPATWKTPLPLLPANVWSPKTITAPGWRTMKAPPARFPWGPMRRLVASG